MAELPSSAYYVAGALILTNISSFVSVLVLMFKVGIFVAETKLGIKDAKDAANRSHKRIDKVEEKVFQN